MKHKPFPSFYSADRRQFLALGSMAAAGAMFGSVPAHSDERVFTAHDYERALVIDALGSINEPQSGLTLESPPSPRLLADLRDSGVTAVSMTLSVGSSGDRMAKAIRKIATFDEKVTAASDALLRIRTAADLHTAKATQRVGLIYNVQDTSLIETDLTRVALLQSLGVRVIQLTYNTRNLVGDGCLERGNAGLSNFGHELIAELQRTGVVIDLSHGGQRTIAEAIAASKAPLVISHTGCRDITEHPRNVFDKELKALADRGGVVGIYFMPFLAKVGPAHSGNLIRHIEHAVNVCGEDHVGLGTDGQISTVEIDDAYRAAAREEYASRIAQGIAAPGEGPDAFQLIFDYNEPRKFLHLAEDLARRGWPARRIEKLLGANFARVYAQIWG